MLLGVDLSHHNFNPNFKTLADAGVHFVFQKVSQGATFVDPTWPRNRKAAQSEQLIVFPYHYFTYTLDAVAQAKHFISTVGNFSGLGAPALDLELDSNQRGGIDPAAYVRSALAFLAEIRQHLPGVRPFVYSYHDFFDTFLGGPKAFAAEGDREWLASYSGVPHPLTGFKTIDVLQFTDQGHIGGLSGVDEDKINGTLADLKKLVIP